MNDEISITSVFGIKSVPGVKIEFDQDDPGKSFLMGGAGLGTFRVPLSEVKAVLAAFEDKFPFAFEKKEG